MREACEPGGGDVLREEVRVGEAEVSRQTVSNKVSALREVVRDVERVKETPEELHLFADEDHVRLKDGRNAIVPLVTISEGIDASNPKRHRLVNPLHSAGYGMEAEAFNDQVEACVYERYDLEKVKRIYIHGDGASRIVALGERFPNAEHVLDGFHLEKYLKKLGHCNGAAQRMGAIRSALRDGNWKTYKRLLETIYTLQVEKDSENCKNNRAWAGYDADEYFRVCNIAMGLMDGELEVDLETEYLPDGGHRLPGLTEDGGIQRIARVLTKAEEAVKAQLEGTAPSEEQQEATPQIRIGFQIVSGSMFSHSLRIL